MKKLPLLIDAHEDLAWNMATFQRDYTRPVAESRRLERGTAIPGHSGDTLLGWDAYQQGRVAVVFATIFAAPMRANEGEWDTQCYLEDSQAETLYRNQLDLYHRLVDQQPDKFRLIQTKMDLDETISAWEAASDEAAHPPVGLVILMEGAEGIRSVDELSEWAASGVRLIGPAWEGTRYCGGTKEPGPLTKVGYQLLDAMADQGLILDLSHMDEQAARQALDHYPGTIVATHSNAKALLPQLDSNRNLSDGVIEGLIERGGVIGVVPYNLFLEENWAIGMRRELVSIQKVVDQIDHICQLAGDAKHVGIGSDFDGGFGWQSVPHEIDTVADLQKLAPLLAEKGFSEADIAAIFGENWLGVLQSALP
ncbi:MAG: membrane dipeptidase [Chloroflexota bacterium]